MSNFLYSIGNDLLDLDQASEAASIIDSFLAESDAASTNGEHARIDPEIVEIFRMESEEIFDSVRQNIEILRADPANENAVWTIKRHIHTFKGSAAIVGLSNASAGAHRLETTIDQFTSSSPENKQRVFASLCEQIETLRIETAALLASLEEPSVSDEGSTVPADLQSVSTPNGDRTEFVLAAPETPKLAPPIAAPAVKAPEPVKKDRFTRVKNHDLNELERAIQFATLSERSLAARLAELNIEHHDSAIADHQERLRMIRSLIFEVRNIPFESIRHRLERTVRVAAEETGKEVSLQIIGGAEPIRSELLEELTEPLMHLIRNCAVHGIEDSDKRRFRGKPENGTIRILYKVVGLEIKINVSDDGNGIDLDRVKHRAAEQGLRTETELETADADELCELIFEPGFSTAERLSMNAGRGIGMSIVKDGLVALGGNIKVATERGKGTEFSISIVSPETMIEGLVLEVGRQLFAIPLGPEISVVSDREESLFQKTGMGSMSELYISQIAESAALNPISCGVVEIFSTPVRIFADRSLGVQHILLEEIDGSAIEQKPAFRRGRIDLSSEVQILDPDAISNHLKDELAAARRIPSSDLQGTATEYVLVVDDSPSIRRAHEDLVKKEGLNCLTANDGLEALEIILSKAACLPAAIITDYEMPRMNGLELTEHLKRRELYSGIPIFLVTSNTDPEVRKSAARCGLSGVFLKPIDPEILKRALLDCLAVSG